MELENIRKNKTGMILQFSIPSIIAMLVTSLITITDGFFTGNYIGKEALAAVNLGLPIVYLYLGLGLMIGVGGSVIAGMALGAKEEESCREVFNQTMLTITVVTCILSVVIGIGFGPVSSFLQAKGIVAGYFRDYYRILLFELPLLIVNNSFGMFIRGEGNPQFFMKISIFNVILNFVLDYLAAGPLGLGIRGIAMSSLLSTGICCVCILFYFFRKSKVYHLGRFRFSREVLRNTIFNGSSEFIGEMSMCITMYAYNFVIIRRIGVDGVTAFTIVGYVSYVFSMIITGFGQGATPLMSFTYGAKDKKLAADIRKKTNEFVFGTGLVVILLMLIGANWYSRIFVSNTEIQEMVQTGVRIFVISFLVSGINTIVSFYFTSIGKAKESAIISSMRGLVVLLICIIVLPMLFGMNGVWMVAPVTEFITIIVSLFFIRQEKRNNLYT